jgi:hypothetical protein
MYSRGTEKEVSRFSILYFVFCIVRHACVFPFSFVCLECIFCHSSSISNPFSSLKCFCVDNNEQEDLFGLLTSKKGSWERL